VERLATALYDEKRAREQLAEAMRAEEKLREEGARLMAESRTPAEELADTIARLDELLRAGAIDAATHGRAVADAYAEMEDAADEALRSSRDWRDGAQRGLQDYAREATDAARAAEQVTVSAFRGMEDALVAFVATGKLDFKSLADSIIADIARVAIRAAITGPLAGAISGLFGALGGLGGGGAAAAGTATASSHAYAAGAGVGAPVYHGGGIVGVDGTSAVFPAAAFLDAPRYHGGGLVAGERAIVARDGEGIFTPAQMKALGRVTVNVINNAGVDVETAERQGPSGLDLEITINEVIARQLGRRGSSAHRAARTAAAGVPVKRR
jgi:lambda family phage tail tape measure protein